MEVVSAYLVKGKKVLLRLDIDVPIENGKVIDDFRLKAGLPTLKLCLENAEEVIILGHIGRPEGREVPSLSVAPIHDWLVAGGFGKVKLLENLRFEPGESFDSAQDKDAVLRFANELAELGNFYVNEAFASYHEAASTTILPTLLPHAAGIRFDMEVKKLTEVRDNPKKPFIAIIGGVKLEDKLPVIRILAEKANAVLVGGLLARHVSEESFNFPHHVLAGHLRPDGLDMADETISAWRPLIKEAKMIVWNGPVGKIRNSKFEIRNLESENGTYEIAKMLLETEAEIVVGGGDTVGFLGQMGLLEDFIKKGLPAGRQGFVSVGGGAMLKFLTDGTLPTIEALK